MDNTVTQEVFKRIDALAEKMGTTAQYLWPKLVAFTQWTAIGQIAATLVVLISCLMLSVWSIKRGIKNDWDEPIDFILSITAGMFVCGLILAAIIEGPNTIARAFSPEAAAFYKLVGK